MLKKLGAACAAIALSCTPAGAACWNENEAAAASVRELQSLLMVSALRCQISHHDMTADYNRFLTANLVTIRMLNERLKTHFIVAAGPVQGQTAYDAFATTLANGHGAEASGAGDCGAMAALAREAALMAGSVEGLLLLAAREGLSVSLPEGSCAAASARLAVASAGGTTGEPAEPAPMQAMAAVVAPPPVLVAEAPRDEGLVLAATTPVLPRAAAAVLTVASLDH